MSLGRLLSTGKSLVGLSSGSRYQLRKGALPKFKSYKNPFAKSPGESAERKLTPAEMAAAHLKKTQRLPLLIPEPPVVTGEDSQPENPEGIFPEGSRVNPQMGAKPVTSPPSSLRSGEEGRGDKLSAAQVPGTIINGWLKKLNPLVWFENRTPTEARSAVPRSSKAPVQGELSLDNIKVMRNDLSDADVEIVPAKPRPIEAVSMSGQAGAAAMAISELRPARTALEFLGGRLLGKD
jgi:hypothetical protein